MANDIKLKIQQGTLEADFTYSAGDLLREGGLETAVMVSLFTDRRADADDSLLSQDDFRGWWGDLVPDTGDKIGSKLWLLDRSKTDPRVPELAKRYIAQALQWMIDDGVASTIEVAAERAGTPTMPQLRISIGIWKNKKSVLSVNFDDLWSAQYAL